jgi:mRNA interferase MazF
MRRGELYRLFKPPGDTKQHRVFVIVSRQALIDSRYSTVIGAPIYTEGQGISSQMRVGIHEGLKHESWIHCDGLVSIPKSELTQYVGSLSTARLFELNSALARALGMEF